jgi:branched-chain amino acid transport system ATP-binding protein
MIRVSGLRAGYGGLDILRGVDLHVEKGGITCIVGPNGAGKSTVLKAMTGILAPRGGSVVIGGTDLTGKPPEAILRAGVACVPQRHGLFTRLSVRQNVLMGAYVIRRRRSHIEARYEQLAQLFPLLAERPGVAAGALSGGQRRMVEFARALMLEPKVVLLDEPTLGLDPRSVAIISGSIAAMNEAGTTILMVEQNVRFGLSLAQHATVLSAGAVALDGPAGKIASHPGLMGIFFGAADPGASAAADPGASAAADPGAFVPADPHAPATREPHRG